MIVTSYVIPIMIVGMLLMLTGIMFIDRTSVHIIRRISILTVFTMLAGSISLFIKRIKLADDDVLTYAIDGFTKTLTADQTPMQFSFGLLFEINVFTAWLVVLINTIAIIAVISGHYIKTRHKHFYLCTLMIFMLSLVVAMSAQAWLTFIAIFGIAIMLFLMLGIWSKSEQYQFATRFIFLQTTGLCFIGFSLLLLQFVIMDDSGQQLLLQQTMAYIDTYVYLNISEVGYRNLALLFMLVGFAFLIPLVGFHRGYIDLFRYSSYPVLLLVVGLYIPLIAFSFKQYMYSFFLDYMSSIQLVCTILAVIQITYMAINLWKAELTKEWTGYLTLANIPIMYILLVSDMLVTVSFGLMSILSYMLTMSLLLVVMMALNERKIDGQLEQIKGLYKQKPYLSSMVTLTLLAVTGLPIFSHYFTVFHAFFSVYHLNSLVFVICLGSVFLVAINVFLHMSKLFIASKDEVNKGQFIDLRLVELIAPIVLIALVFMLGIYPSVFLEKVEVYVEEVLGWLADYKEVTIWNTDFYWSLLLGDKISTSFQFAIAALSLVTLVLTIWLGSRQRQKMLSWVYIAASHFASVGLAGLVVMRGVSDFIVWRQLAFYIIAIGIIFVGTHYLLSRHMYRSMYDEATHYEGLYYKNRFMYVSFVVLLFTIIGAPMSPLGIIRFELIGQLILERYMLLAFTIIVSFAFLWRPLWHWLAAMCFPATTHLLLNRKEQLEDWKWTKHEKGLIVGAIIINMVLLMIYIFV